MKISLEESIGEKVLTIDVGTSYKRCGKLYFRAHQVESLLREKYDLNGYTMVEFVDILSNFAGVSVAEYKFIKEKESTKSNKATLKVDKKNVASSSSKKKSNIKE